MSYEIWYVKLLLIETLIIDIIKNEMYYLKQQFFILIVVLLIKIGMKSQHPVISQFKLRKWPGNEKSFSEWRKAWCLQTQPWMSVSSSKSSTGRPRLHSLLERMYCTDWTVPLSSGLGLMTYNYCEYDISKKYFNVKTYFWRIPEKEFRPSMNLVVVMKLV